MTPPYDSTPAQVAGEEGKMSVSSNVEYLKSVRRQRYERRMRRIRPDWRVQRHDRFDCVCGYGCPPFNGCRHP